MRRWARFLVALVIVGVSLTPALARSLAAGADRRAEERVAPEDCCPHGEDDDGREACSPLCAAGCCPARTATGPETGADGTVQIEAPLFVTTGLAALPTGHAREIEYPPSR